MQIYLTGGNGLRLESVYVDRDDAKRTFTAVIADARSNFGVDEIAAKYPSLDIASQRNEISAGSKKTSYTITVKVTFADESNAAKTQMSTFISALAKMNIESHNTGFYLREIEFFRRQVENMSDKLFGRVTSNKHHEANTRDSHPANTAF